ncbi:tubulin epsilon and delta complex protein 2 isoform X2 [Engystomops pustulosus]|uniref:tubulin epsilon and delta complex protein 2 isoform X2 n=1 Tax=Engystomops pustulosus TaxID=76066 RepID=UPI003AFABAC6
MMLSSACSNRLLPLLHQALHRCKEEEKQLEEQIRKWRTLLDNWDAENGDPIKQDEEASEPQVVQPSAEDMQEVELLNKALEKALRVRGTSKMDPPVHKPSIPAPTTCPVTKENPIKALNKLAQKGTRPASYQLHPPYKTIPDRRRIHRPGQRATSSKSARSTPPEPPAPTKCNTGDGGQLEMKTNTTQPSSTLDKPVSPPSRTSGPDISPPQKPSTLKEKGATLKLPVEYQQMYMKSSRLWEKFYAIRDHLPASRPSFIQKLQTTFAPEAPGLSLSELEEATHRLQREVPSAGRSIAVCCFWKRYKEKWPNTSLSCRVSSWWLKNIEIGQKNFPSMRLARSHSAAPLCTAAAPLCWYTAIQVSYVSCPAAD